MGDKIGLHCLPTESPDDVIGVFHSSELEDSTMYADGYYIAAFVAPVIGCVCGPYLTEESATEAMIEGVWMGEHASELEYGDAGYRAKGDRT